ncbi:DUF7502 family protein [Haloquadratum walsbyi]|uniref:DUF7502 family protein n=1 Tax=Haloquadratum walsbyi TaxID=293091 RepID=UPI0008112CB3|nr:hypothetical protein [Haloquadratum walsbyi]
MTDNNHSPVDDDQNTDESKDEQTDPESSQFDPDPFGIGEAPPDESVDTDALTRTTVDETANKSANPDVNAPTGGVSENGNNKLTDEVSAEQSRGGIETQQEQIKRALAEIRKEGFKIAVVYAVVDAAIVTLLINIILLFVGIPLGMPSRVPIPSAIVTILRDTIAITITEPTIATGAVLGVGIGLLIIPIEVGIRIRRPLVDQFAAANPSLQESLQTARDATEANQQSAIVKRLYDDVLKGLNQASSIGLINLRRVATAVVILMILSGATVQLAVVDLSLDEFGADSAVTVAGDREETEYSGLKNGSSILGDETSIREGQQTQNATISTSGSDGGGNADRDSPTAYTNSGFSAEDVQTQQAAFDSDEAVQNAALIREYNLAIRDNSDQTDTTASS